MDFPDEATFLNPLEKSVIISRLMDDGQSSHKKENLKWKSIRAAYTDWKLYIGMLINMGIVGSIYAYALFLPSIINKLGYSPTQAQLLTVPPLATASVLVSTSSAAS